MSKVEDLLKAYERYVRLPWDPGLAGPQKVWFAEYDPGQERRLRPRIPAFEAATTAAGRGWRLVDITNAFAKWMAEHEYKEAYFEQPDDLGMALADFAEAVSDQVRGALEHPDVDEEHRGGRARPGVAVWPHSGLGHDRQHRFVYSRTVAGILPWTASWAQLAAIGRPRRLELPRRAHIGKL